MKLQYINYDLIEQTPFVKMMGGFRSAINRSLHDKTIENTLRGEIYKSTFEESKKQEDIEYIRGKNVGFKSGYNKGYGSGQIGGVQEYIGVGANYMFVPTAPEPISFHPTFPSMLDKHPNVKEYFAKTEATSGMKQEKADLKRAEIKLGGDLSLEKAYLNAEFSSKNRSNPDVDESYKSKYFTLESNHNQAIKQLRDNFDVLVSKKISSNVSKVSLNLQQDLNRSGTKISKIPIVLTDDFNLYNTSAIRDYKNKIADKVDIRDSRTYKPKIKAEKLTEYIQRPVGKDIVTAIPSNLIIPPHTPKKQLQLEGPNETPIKQPAKKTRARVKSISSDPTEEERDIKRQLEPLPSVMKVTPKKSIQKKATSMKATIVTPEQINKEKKIDVELIKKQLDFNDPTIQVEVITPPKKPKNTLSHILKPDIPIESPYGEVPPIASDPKSDIVNLIKELEDEITSINLLIEQTTPEFKELEIDLRTKLKNALRDQKTKIESTIVTATNVKKVLKITKAKLIQNINQTIENDDVIKMYELFKQNLSVTHAKTYEIPFKASYKEYKTMGFKLAKLNQAGPQSELAYQKKKLSGL